GGRPDRTPCPAERGGFGTDLVSRADGSGHEEGAVYRVRLIGPICPPREKRRKAGQLLSPGKKARGEPIVAGYPPSPPGAKPLPKGVCSDWNDRTAEESGPEDGGADAALQRPPPLVDTARSCSCHFPSGTGDAKRG